MKAIAPLLACAGVFAMTVLAASARPQPVPSSVAANIERGTLPSSWITGASCPETPVFRVHEYNADFFILRQSGCTNFEKPFLYVDYPEGTTYQPDEHPLELGRAHLLELADGLAEMRGTIVRRAFRDFTIWPVVPARGP